MKIRGIAENFKNNRRIKEEIRSKYLDLLSLYAKLLNFNEIIGISEISRIERIKISGINT